MDSQAHHAAALFDKAVERHLAGRTAEAEALYREVLAADPRHADAFVNLGAIHRDRGELDLAASAYESALAIIPRHAKAVYNLGDVHNTRHSVAEAEDCFRQAAEIDPDFVEAFYYRGLALTKLDRLGDARRAFERTLELQPAHAPALNSLGVVLQQQGHFDEAAAAFRRAIALGPRTADAIYNLLSLAATTKGSSGIEAMREILEPLEGELDAFQPDDRAKLLFAMGRAFETLGGYDRAFEAIAAANAIMRTKFPGDVSLAERRMEQIAAVFTPALLSRLHNEGLASERPIFVVGMPRSGTTLVEQIISAHPAVHGAGELPALAKLILTIRGAHGSVYPDWARRMTGVDCRVIGQSYLDALPQLAPGERRLTDKWLTNFEHLGLIRACLPNARVIYCRRDPRDICLSCFSLHFNDDSNAYSYDLTQLGRYWRAQDRLMAHWRAVLPAEFLLEAPYEEVVGDVEAWARRLIAHCGLEWDDACLRYYESDRVVRTASLAQVRQPIYTDSVGRWRRFERHLGPLLDALGEPYKSGGSTGL